MDKEDKSIQQMSEPLSSPSAGHLMDMGPNEKYFKHMKQTSGEREKRIKLSAGRSRREQAKEVVTPQCLLSVCLCVCTKGPLVPAYLLGKLAPKESKVSFGISSCLSSRLQGNLTICPPGQLLIWQGSSTPRSAVQEFNLVSLVVPTPAFCYSLIQNRKMETHSTLQ
ncbi:uncharacterized protein J5F26_000046 isoform 8-T30 [Ciconia maguari]